MRTHFAFCVERIATKELQRNPQGISTYKLINFEDVLELLHKTFKVKKYVIIEVIIIFMYLISSFVVLDIL